MFIPAACFALGLVAMGRTKPKTAVRKLLCLGPRSGLVYPVEDFPEIGTVIVRAPKGATGFAQFIRASVRTPGAAGLIWQHGSGDPRLLEVMRRDFAVEMKPAAVPNGGNAAAPKTAAEGG